MYIINNKMNNKMHLKTSTYAYKSLSTASLSITVHHPPQEFDGVQCPALIFFHGGAWKEGSADQFMHQSIYLASKGIVCFTVEYRVSSRHGSTPFDSLIDAKDAVKWVRDNSDIFGINPLKIVVAGGSAGGHLAACCAIIKSPQYDTNEIYQIPKAMVLFNPVLDTIENNYIFKLYGRQLADISPMHHVTGGLPPAIIFQGEKDEIVPYQSCIKFRDIMMQNKNQCILRLYPNQEHGFFNFNENNNPFYWETLLETEKFICSVEF